MKWIVAKSDKDGKKDCLVQIEVSNNNTENRNEIIDINNALYHTDSIKIISITNCNTKEKINSAYYTNEISDIKDNTKIDYEKDFKYNDILININQEIKYDNSILDCKCTDKGFEYYLTANRAINEITTNRTMYYYDGDKFCNLSMLKLN